MTTLTQALERLNAQARARLGHPFHVVKKLFRYKKTRTRKLDKNEAQHCSLFGPSNLVLAKKQLIDRKVPGMSAA